MGNALVIAVGTAVFLVPGLAVGAALGIRGWLLTGLAPALTMGTITVGIQAATLTGVPWSLLFVSGVTAVLAVVLALLTRPWRRKSPDSVSADDSQPTWSWWHHVGVAASLITTFALGLRSTSQATGGFEQVNQTWDAFFHAGAIRLIAEGGNPAPSALGAIAAQASPSFFTPDTYHATAALVLLTTGAQVTTVMNVLAGLLPLLLGLCIVSLFRATTGRPAHAVCGALLSVAVIAVPYHMVGYGTLLPYGTTLVMLGGVSALFATLFDRPRWTLGLALGIALAGLLSAHPQVAFLVVVIGLLQLGWALVRARRLTAALSLTVLVSLITFVAVGAPVLLATVRTAAGAAGIDWPAYTNPGGAFGDLLLFNAASPYPQWWLAPLLMLGLLAVMTRDRYPALRPFLASAAIVAGLYVLAGAYDTPLSLAVTSPWWNDRHRLAAAFAVLGIVFAAVGAVAIRDWVSTQVTTIGSLHSQRTARVVPVVLLVLGLTSFFVVSGGAYAAATQAGIAAGYGTSPTLSDRERTGLAEVAQIVSSNGGGRVMNDPHDGCGWAYALNGTEVVFPTPLTGPFNWANLGYDRMRLYERFDELDDDPQIENDSELLGVRWAVVCTGFIRDWQSRAPGLDEIDQMRSANLEFSNGAVRLYQIGRVGPPTSSG